MIWSFGILLVLLVVSEILVWRAAKETETIGRRDAAILFLAGPMGALYALLIFPWSPHNNFPETWNAIGTVVGSLTMFGVCLYFSRKIRRDGELKYSAFGHVGNLMAMTTVSCFTVALIYLLLNA